MGKNNKNTNKDVIGFTVDDIIKNPIIASVKTCIEKLEADTSKSKTSTTLTIGVAATENDHMSIKFFIYLYRVVQLTGKYNITITCNLEEIEPYTNPYSFNKDSFDCAEFTAYCNSIADSINKYLSKEDASEDMEICNACPRHDYCHYVQNKDGDDEDCCCTECAHKEECECDECCGSCEEYESVDDEDDDDYLEGMYADEYLIPFVDADILHQNIITIVDHYYETGEYLPLNELEMPVHDIFHSFFGKDSLIMGRYKIIKDDITKYPKLTMEIIFIYKDHEQYNTEYSASIMLAKDISDKVAFSNLASIADQMSAYLNMIR